MRVEASMRSHTRRANKITFSAGYPACLTQDIAAGGNTNRLRPRLLLGRTVCCLHPKAAITIFGTYALQSIILFYSFIWVCTVHLCFAVLRKCMQGTCRLIPNRYDLNTTGIVKKQLTPFLD
jgi:hypothetical protein